MVWDMGFQQTSECAAYEWRVWAKRNKMIIVAVKELPLKQNRNMRNLGGESAT